MFKRKYSDPTPQLTPISTFAKTESLLLSRLWIYTLMIISSFFEHFEIEFLEELLDYVGWSWLRNNLIYPKINSFNGVRLLRMTRNCRNNRLFELLFFQESSNLLGGLVAIHDWHIAVHKDQFIVTKFPIVFFDVVFNHL